MENRKLADDLIIANKTLVFQNLEKGKRAEELIVINSRLKETEEKLKKASHLYAFISQVNQKIVRVKDEEELFHNACTIAIEFGKFKMAWIGLFDTEHEKITLVDQSGMSADDIGLFIDAPNQANGLQENILRTGSYFVCNDVRNDFPFENRKLFMAERGYLACMVIPVNKSGKIIGTFNLYSSELNFFNKEEIALLLEVTGDISFALDLFEKAKAQKKTEELVVHNETRYRLLIEKSTDMKTLTSREGKVLYGSPSIQGVLGYTIEEYLLKYPQDLIHPDDLDSYIERRNKLMQTPGKSFHFEQRRHHKNGTWIWCEGTLTNFLEEPGIRGMVSNFRDVSEKKVADKRQEFDRNNLNALINNTSDLMWSVDKDFNLITSNEPFDEMSEVNFGKIIPKGGNVLSVSYTPEMMKHFKGLYERAFAGETFTETEHFDYPVELWTEISYYPILKGDEVIGTACHSRDITGIKKAEQQIRKSEAFNLGVLNSLSSHIAVIDDLGNIIAVNEAWKRFALENGETTLERTGVGSNYFKECAKAAKAGDEIAAKAAKGIMDVLQGKMPDFCLEYPCHSPDKQRWFSMRAKRFESDEVMVVVAHENITERKLAEEGLLQSESLLVEAQRLAKLGSWNWDNKKDKLTWSEELYNVYDIDKQTFTETYGSFLHLVDVADRERALQISKNTRQTGDAFTIEYQITTRKGEKRIIQEYGYGEKDDNGSVIRLFGTAQDITERKKAEEEIKKSEIRFREIFDSAPESIVIIDINTMSFTKFNNNALKLLRYSAEELIKKGPVDVSPPFQPDGRPTEEKARELITRAVNGENLVFDWMLIDGNGKEIIIEVRLAPLSGNDGPQVIANFADIGERKRAELLIRESEARLAEAQAISKVGNWEVDLMTLKLKWSAETFKIFELNADDFELTYKAFMQFVYPDDRAKVEKAVKGSFNSEIINSLEHRIVTATGKIKIVEDRWQVMRDKQELPNRILGTSQDITERKRTEEILQLTQFAFDHAGDAIFWMTSDARIMNVNESACYSLGYTRQELLALSIPDIDPGFNNEAWSAFFPELRKKNSIFIETTQQAKDGRRIPVEIRANYIKFGDQEFSCAFVRDISERRKVEENLEMQNKELKKTNTELDRFVYSTSHDLRAPLASLLGLIEMIDDDIETDNTLQKERIGMMKGSVMKLDSFIGEILDYSRNARSEVTKEEIDFKKAVEEVRGNLKYMEGTSGMNLKVEIENKEIFVSDKRRVNVILSNLISNALKYRDLLKTDSFVSIHIQTFKENATIVIEDNGIGIAEKDKEKIFEMFYRASKQSTGSGLGLYIVKETIEKLNASITLESQKSAGSKFTVIIPNLLNDESKKHSPD